MAVYAFQVTIPTDSAIPADYVTNTWHFSTVGALPVITDFDNVRDMLDDFYSTSPSGGGIAISDYYANNLGNTVQVKAYALEDSPPRAPAYESTFNAAWSGTNNQPAEVALVMSFQAARVSGTPQSRRRNRVYLGPWGTNGAGSDGRPAPALITQIQRAATDLAAAASSSVNWNWVIWSPTQQQDYQVDNGWIDNAWDTQRRRGPKPTSRTTFESP